MAGLKTLSIKKRLILIMLLVAVSAAIAGVAFSAFREIHTFRNDMIAGNLALARVIGDYSVVDLTFSDQPASKRTLARMAVIPSVEFVYLFDKDGNLFSSYSRNGKIETPPGLRESSVEFKDDYLEMFQPVLYQDQKYGTICILASAKPLTERIRNITLTTLLVILVLIVLSFILASQLQTLISRPILNLTSAVAKISTEGDYSVRAVKSGEEELDLLCDAFNDMLNQIENREKERNKAENALRESEDRYRGLVESSPEIILVEQSENIVYMNPSGIQLLGFEKPKELYQKNMLSLVAPAQKDKFQEILKTNWESPLLLETQFLDVKGKQLDVEVAVIRTSYRGEPALQVVVRDVTERKGLRQAAERMERLAALGELSATIAHEIRNSLGSITLNFRTVVERMENPERNRGILTNLELAITRIQNLIRGILNFARPAPPTFRPVDLHKILDSSLLPVEKELEQAGITVVKNYSASNSDVLVDPNQIVQVFLNLFFNAKHAMPSGGTLTISTTLQNGWVEARVDDTGKGIPEENLQKIFNPFFTTTPDGIGLGLAIVSRILEQHRSQVFVQSKPGSGTSFTIRFQQKTEQTASI